MGQSEIYFMDMSGQGIAAPSKNRPRRALMFLAVVWSIGAGFLVLQALFLQMSDFSLGHLVPVEMGLAKQSAAGAAHCRDVLKTVAVVNQGAVSASRYGAWNLGFQLGFAGAIHDASRITKTLADAQTLAHSLGVPEVALPKGHAAYGMRDFSVSLEEDPQCVSATLAARYSAQHASLYKLGAAVGLAMVYRAAISDTGAILEPEIKSYGRTAGVPPELWQPLLEKRIAIEPGSGSRVAAVQGMVRRLDSYIKTLD